MDQQISPNITLSQVTASKKAKALGIDNTPGELQYKNCQLLSIHVIEPLFAVFGRIGFSSFFRCKKLNSAVGGSDTSDHMALIGAAVDLNAKLGGKCTNAQIFEWIRHNLQFDQLIWEFGTASEPQWVHVSYRSSGNRNQVLVSSKANGKTIYRQKV